MISSKDIAVAFDWLNVDKEMEFFNIKGRKRGKTYYVTDEEFNHFLARYPGYKKMWRKYSRDLHSL